MSERNNVKAAHDFFEAWNAGDLRWAVANSFRWFQPGHRQTSDGLREHDLPTKRRQDCLLLGVLGHVVHADAIEPAANDADFPTRRSPAPAPDFLKKPGVLISSER